MTVLIMGKGIVPERSQCQPELRWVLEMEKGKSQSITNKFPKCSTQQHTDGHQLISFPVLNADFLANMIGKEQFLKAFFQYIYE